MKDIPADAPRIAINAANLTNGKRFRFSRDSYGDYHSGYSETGAGEVSIAAAVAASAAFPPPFSPYIIQCKGPFSRWTFDSPPRALPVERPDGIVALTDGGVYENLGLHAATQRCGEIVALDAGLPLDLNHPAPRGLLSATLRGVDILMSQVLARTVTPFVKRLLSGEVRGMLIRTSHSVKRVATVSAGSFEQLVVIPDGFSKEVAEVVASLRTDLDAFTELEIEALVWHGRTLANAAAIRFTPSWVTQDSIPLGIGPTIGPRQLVALRKGERRNLRSLFAFWRGC